MEGNGVPKDVTPVAPGPNDPQPIRPGMIVYFREAKFNPRGKKETAMRFKGHGFGIFLGHVPQLAPSPPLPLVKYIISNIGFIGCDDIKELMGQEVIDTLVKRMEEKYAKLLGFPADAPSSVKPSGLVTPGGAPLKLNDPPKLN